MVYYNDAGDMYPDKIDHHVEEYNNHVAEMILEITVSR